MNAYQRPPPGATPGRQSALKLGMSNGFWSSTHQEASTDRCSWAGATSSTWVKSITSHVGAVPGGGNSEIQLRPETSDWFDEVVPEVWGVQAGLEEDTGW